MSDLLTIKLQELAGYFGDGAKAIPYELVGKLPPELLAEAKSVGLDVFDMSISDLIQALLAWGLEHANLIFKILRFIQPVLVFRNFALITRYQDVVDALAQDDVFEPTNGQQLRNVAGNDFLLGMPNTADYTRDQANLRLVIRRGDIAERVIPFVSQAAASIVSGAGGTLEIVGGLTRAVPAAWVGDYFGTPGPTAAMLTGWCIAIFNYLTIPPGTDPVGELEGLAAGKAFQLYLDVLIAYRHLNPGSKDDVLDRLIALQKTRFPGLADDLIKSNLVGMISGAIPPMATMAAIAMDQLLGLPVQLAGAQAAARANDDQLLGRYLDEAMRFRPIGPGVLRVTTQDYVVGKTDWYAKTVPKGTTVMVATQSAMFDEALFDDPDAFRIDRNEYNFLLFGSGQHNCFGKYIVSALIPQMLKPLLQQQNLRRAQGDAGTLQMSGVQAKSMTLQYKA